MYKKSPHKFHVVIRIIALILIFAFIVQDIAWSNPDTFTASSSSNTKLAPSSLFKLPNEESIDRVYASFIYYEIDKSCARAGIKPDALKLTHVNAVLKRLKDEGDRWFNENVSYSVSEDEVLIQFTSGYTMRYYYYSPNSYSKYIDRKTAELPIPEIEGLIHVQLLRTNILPRAVITTTDIKERIKACIAEEKAGEPVWDNVPKWPEITRQNERYLSVGIQMRSNYALLQKAGKALESRIDRTIEEELAVSKIIETINGIIGQQQGSLPGFEHVVEMLESARDALKKARNRSKILAHDEMGAAISLLQQRSIEESYKRLENARELLTVRRDRMRSDRNILTQALTEKICKRMGEINNIMRGLARGIIKAAEYKKIAYTKGPWHPWEEAVYVRYTPAPYYQDATNGYGLTPDETAAAIAFASAIMGPVYNRVREVARGIMGEFARVRKDEERSAVPAILNKITGFSNSIINRCDDADRVALFTRAYQLKWIELRLKGTEYGEARRTAFFEVYKDFASTANISRGSPEYHKYFALFFITLFVPELIKAKPASKDTIQNPLYHPALQMLRIISTNGTEYNSLGYLSGPHSGIGESGRTILKKYINTDKKSFAALSDEEKEIIIDAVAADNSLDVKGTSLLRNISGIERQTTLFSFFALNIIYFAALLIWGGFELWKWYKSGHSEAQRERIIRELDQYSTPSRREDFKASDRRVLEFSRSFMALLNDCGLFKDQDVLYTGRALDAFPGRYTNTTVLNYRFRRPPLFDIIKHFLYKLWIWHLKAYRDVRPNTVIRLLNKWLKSKKGKNKTVILNGCYNNLWGLDTPNDFKRYLRHIDRFMKVGDRIIILNRRDRHYAIDYLLHNGYRHLENFISIEDMHMINSCLERMTEEYGAISPPTTLVVLEKVSPARAGFAHDVKDEIGNIAENYLADLAVKGSPYRKPIQRLSREDSLGIFSLTELCRNGPEKLRKFLDYYISDTDLIDSLGISTMMGFYYGDPHTFERFLNWHKNNKDLFNILGIATFRDCLKDKQKRFMEVLEMLSEKRPLFDMLAKNSFLGINTVRSVIRQNLPDFYDAFKLASEGNNELLLDYVIERLEKSEEILPVWYIKSAFSEDSERLISGLLRISQDPDAFFAGLEFVSCAGGLKEEEIGILFVKNAPEFAETMQLIHKKRAADPENTLARYVIPGMRLMADMRRNKNNYVDGVGFQITEMMKRGSIEGKFFTGGIIRTLIEALMSPATTKTEKGYKKEAKKLLETAGGPEAEQVFEGIRRANEKNEGKSFNELSLKLRLTRWQNFWDRLTGGRLSRLPKLNKLKLTEKATLSKDDLEKLIYYIHHIREEDQTECTDFMHKKFGHRGDPLYDTFSYMMALAGRDERVRQIVLKSLTLKSSNREVSAIIFAISDRLPVNSARYYDQTSNSAVIVFNEDFFDIGKKILYDIEADIRDVRLWNSVYHVIMERLLHEFAHDNNISKDKRIKMKEETGINAAIDAPLNEITRELVSRKDIDIDGLRRIKGVKEAMQHSGDFFEMMPGPDTVSVDDDFIDGKITHPFLPDVGLFKIFGKGGLEDTCFSLGQKKWGEFEMFITEDHSHIYVTPAMKEIAKDPKRPVEYFRFDLNNSELGYVKPIIYHYGGQNVHLGAVIHEQHLNNMRRSTVIGIIREAIAAREETVKYPRMDHYWMNNFYDAEWKNHIVLDEITADPSKSTHVALFVNGIDNKDQKIIDILGRDLEKNRYILVETGWHKFEDLFKKFTSAYTLLFEGKKQADMPDILTLSMSMIYGDKSAAENITIYAKIISFFKKLVNMYPLSLLFERKKQSVTNGKGWATEEVITERARALVNQLLAEIRSGGLSVPKRIRVEDTYKNVWITFDIDPETKRIVPPHDYMRMSTIFRLKLHQVIFKSERILARRESARVAADIPNQTALPVPSQAHLRHPIFNDEEEAKIDNLWRAIVVGRKEMQDKARIDLEAILDYEQAEDKPLIKVGSCDSLFEFVETELNRRFSGRISHNELTLLRDNLKYGIENIRQHGRDRGALIIRPRFDNDGDATVSVVLLDDGDGFIDKECHHVPLHEAVKPGVTTGENGVEGVGLSNIIESSLLASITEVDWGNEEPSTYYWEKGPGPEQRLDFTPVEHGTKLEFVMELPYEDKELPLGPIPSYGRAGFMPDQAFYLASWIAGNIVLAVGLLPVSVGLFAAGFTCGVIFTLWLLKKNKKTVKPKKIYRTEDLMVHIPDGLPYINNISEIPGYLKNTDHPVIAVCNPEEECLRAVFRARAQDLINGARFIGDANEIMPRAEKIRSEMGLDSLASLDFSFESIERSPADSYYSRIAARAVELLNKGEVGLIMKSLIETSILMKAYLKSRDKNDGLINHVNITQYKDRMFFVSDPGINTDTDNYDKMIEEIRNAVRVAGLMGRKRPDRPVKVALISAFEKPTPNIPSTIFAERLASEKWPKDIIVSPISLDCAISKKIAVAKVKGDNPVAGDADVFIFFNIDVGNVAYKIIEFVLTEGAEVDMANVVMSTKPVPIILVSRTDPESTKWNSILTTLYAFSQNAAQAASIEKYNPQLLIEEGEKLIAAGDAEGFFYLEEAFTLDGVTLEQQHMIIEQLILHMRPPLPRTADTESAEKYRETAIEILEWLLFAGSMKEMSWVYDSLLSGIAPHMATIDRLYNSFGKKYKTRILSCLTNAMHEHEVFKKTVEENKVFGDQVKRELCKEISRYYRKKNWHNRLFKVVIGTTALVVMGWMAFELIPPMILAKILALLPASLFAALSGLMYYFSGISWFADFGFGMNLQLAMRYDFKQVQAQLLLQELTESLLPGRSLLIPGMDLPALYKYMSETSPEIWRNVSEHGRIRTYKKHGLNFQYAVLTHDDYKKHDKFGQVFKLCGGGMVSYDNKTNSYLIFVDGDMLSEEFIEYAAVHEKGETLFNDHIKATMLEFAVSDKDKKFTDYLNWLRAHYPSKFSSIFTYIEGLENFIPSENRISPKEATGPPVEEPERENYKIAKKITDSFKWPIDALKLCYVYEEANQEAEDILRSCFTDIINTIDQRPAILNISAFIKELDSMVAAAVNKIINNKLAGKLNIQRIRAVCNEHVLAINDLVDRKWYQCWELRRDDDAKAGAFSEIAGNKYLSLALNINNITEALESEGERSAALDLPDTSVFDVISATIEEQKEYLEEKNPLLLRPVFRRDIAERSGMSEPIVSRALEGIRYILYKGKLYPVSVLIPGKRFNYLLAESIFDSICRDKHIGPQELKVSDIYADFERSWPAAPGNVPKRNTVHDYLWQYREARGAVSEKAASAEVRAPLPGAPLGIEMKDLTKDRIPYCPESHLDRAKDQHQLFLSGKPIEFTDGGLLYDGRDGLDEAIMRGYVPSREIRLTRSPHVWAAGEFISSSKSPAIYVISSSRFNKFLHDGQATLSIKHDKTNQFFQPFPTIFASLMPDDILEIWTDEETYRRYERIIKSPSTTDEEALKPKLEELLKSGKLLMIPGLFHSRLDKNLCIDECFLRIGGYMQERGLLDHESGHIPKFRLRGESKSAEPGSAAGGSASVKQSRSEDEVGEGESSNAGAAETDELFASIQSVATLAGEEKIALPDNNQILLSETLFELGDASNLRRLLDKNSPVRVVTAEEARAAATNERTGKNNTVCVVSVEDYDGWDSNNRSQVKASLLILSEDLQAERFLYLEGIVRLAAAMMSNDRDKISVYMKLLFKNISEGIDDKALVEYLLTDPRKLAGLIKFMPITPFNNDKLLDKYKRKVEDILVMA